MAEQESLSIVYEEQDPRPTVPVSGAYGGPTPDASMVVVHTYVESGTIPAMEEHQVEAGGRVDLGKGNVIKRGDLTRKVLATLVMSPEVAITVGTWLVDKGNLAIKGRTQNPKGNS